MPELPVGADPGDLISEVAEKARVWSSFLAKVPAKISTMRTTLASGEGRGIAKSRDYDVVIVGFGAAGAAAALEAAAGNARVLIIDGSIGGGSTQRSGGVIYLGGGTQSQTDAGYEDDAENMYRCLKIDTEGAVDDDRLRAFCNESKANFEWLRQNGVRFADPATGKAVYWKEKASLPPGDTTLYCSGNEEAEPWSRVAKYAPRGHWPWFPGCGDEEVKNKLSAPMRGHALFNSLYTSVIANKNIEVRAHCKATQLVTGADGRVVGLKVRELPELQALRSLNQMLYNIATMTEYDITGNVRKTCMRFSHGLYDEFGEAYDLAAAKGVVISAGGYFFNDAWVKKYAPDRLGNMPLGNMGDDGSGINLGLQVGAATHMMSRATTWKFMAPPNGFLCAVFVDTVSARRFSNEDVYNAKLIDRQFARAGGKAWCLLDSNLYEEIEAEANDGDNVLYGFQRALSVVSLKGASVQGNTWAELAKATGLPAQALEDTIARYNEDALLGGDTNFGKHPKYMKPLSRAPFYAVWVDATIGAKQRTLMGALPIGAPSWMPSWMPLLPVVKAAVNLGVTMPPSPTFSLGGLHVDIDQQVLREGSLAPIPGLYAAGRSAAGVATGGYVSGLSIADGIFGGRRAGRHAAARGVASGAVAKL